MKNKFTRISISFVLAFAFIQLGSAAYAATTSLGNGYKCVDGTLYKGGKTIKLSVAKNAIKTAISQLGSSKKDKAKKASLQATKAALASCTSGGGGSGEALETILSGNFLHFTGQYFLNSGTVAGAMTVDISSTATGIRLSFNIAGNTSYFTQAAAFDADFASGSRQSATSTINGTTIGNVKVSFTKDSTINSYEIILDATAVPSASFGSAGSVSELYLVIVIEPDHTFPGTFRVLGNGGILATGTLNLSGA